MTFILRRLAFYLLAGWASLSLAFLLPRLMPGDPAAAMFGRFKRHLDPEALEVLSKAVEAAANSESFVATLQERGFKHVWRPGAEFEAFMAEDLDKMQVIFDQLEK